MGNATKKQLEYAQQISQALNIAMPDVSSRFYPGSARFSILPPRPAAF